MFLAGQKFYLFTWSSLLSIILIFFLVGCIFMNKSNQKDKPKTCYFSSPAEAVQIISELLG